jgi:hypothetical protein
MANAIHENIRGLISELNNAGLSGLTMPLLIIAITTLVGEISTPVPLLDGVIGVVVGMVASIALAYWTWKEGLDLAQLLLDLDANEQDLVCALYNSSNGNDALTAYLDTLDTYGTSAANLALLETVVVIDLVNRLYFAKDAGEEAALESYTGTVDCSGCGTCQWTVITGSGTILTDNTPFVISSAENAEGNQDIIIGLLPQHCSCAYTIEVVSWTSTPNDGFGVWDCNGVRVETLLEPIVGSWDNASWLGQTEASSTPFTMTLKIRLT